MNLCHSLKAKRRVEVGCKEQEERGDECRGNVLTGFVKKSGKTSQSEMKKRKGAERHFGQMERK